MYCYIYDDLTQHQRFAPELALIENRLTDLGIAGKIVRMALFRNVQEMVRDEIRRGTTSVIAVGNDETVHKVIDVISGTNVVLGIIPLGEGNELAALLGVPHGLAACDVLSARIVETIDAGIVNGKRFLTSISVPNFGAELTCDGAYRITPDEPSFLEIRNLGGDASKSERISDPTDGRLETILRVSVKQGWLGRRSVCESVLPLTTLAIRSETPISITADGEEMTGTRFDIGIESGVIRVISGRNRKF
ncbi:MAG: diacylglycerol kinase family protein [Candidatus Uhrbacteria bacterium]